MSKYFEAMTSIPIPYSYHIPALMQEGVAAWPRKGIHFPYEVCCRHSFATSKEKEKEKRSVQDKGIDSFYNSDVCFFCKKAGEGSFIICEECRK